MTRIDQLNRRLAEGLGSPFGKPRFQWIWSPTSIRWFRASRFTDAFPVCLASQIGPCWLLAQWRSPMSETEWMAVHGEHYPYRPNGEYLPMTETALPAGMEPTGALTYGYIRTIGDQMDRAALALKENYAGRVDATTESIEAAAQKEVADAEAKFHECAADWEPLSWKLGDPHDPCTQDGPVSFGGIAPPPAPAESQAA